MKRTILVKRYLRRHPTTPKQTVLNAVGVLKKLDADDNLKHLCYVQVSDMDSQVIPSKAGFRRGACTVANIEMADVHDVVEAATTLYHEALHSRDIAVRGVEGVGKENEVAAHRETVHFLRDWLAKEKDKATRARIREEIDEEFMSIRVLGMEED